MEKLLNSIDGIVWGPIMLALILGTGLYLSFGLKFITIRKIVHAFKTLWANRTPSNKQGEITGFQALMTSLSATVGTGNIAGVATAIFLGGPGAVFWMWITAIVGMATKYAEAVLAVHYREKNTKGQFVGGPMYYIKNGMSSRWHWLAGTFAFFGMVAAFGIGNTIQANSVADSMKSALNVDPLVTGIVMAILAGAVILGGVKRLAKVAEKTVPIMAILYIVGALIVILSNIEQIPTAISTIVNDAFTGSAATGGFAGASVWMAIRFGVARGVFSNEAGLGSAPIAHAAAQTNSPVKQGMIGMLGTFIDTIILCTMTALVIVMTGVWTQGETGASLTMLAFNSGLSGFGGYVVSFGLILFAFTTILGWSYYGERCASYLLGDKIIIPYRVLWIIAIPIGAISQLSFLWLLADVLNAMMAIPNLIALLALSPVVFKLTKEYFND